MNVLCVRRATQSLQRTIAYCWWKLAINYLCSTNFVYYGILISFLSVDDITKTESCTKQNEVKPWLI